MSTQEAVRAAELLSQLIALRSHQPGPDGIGGNEQCVWAQGGQSGDIVEYYPVGYGVIDGACFSLNVKRVLCQDRPAAQLGYGPFLGQVSATTVTEGTGFLFTETTTVFTSVTFFP